MGLGLQDKIWRGHNWTCNIWSMGMPVFWVFFSKFPSVIWWLAKFGGPLFRDLLASDSTLGILMFFLLKSLRETHGASLKALELQMVYLQGWVMPFASRLILMDILIGGYCPASNHSQWYPRLVIPPVSHLELFIMWSWSTLSDVCAGRGGH